MSSDESTDCSVCHGVLHAMNDIVERATALADHVLFPRANETDRADLLPEENLDALADAGFYGLFAPPELGGLGADFPTMCASVEAIAGGCLTTALVWVQHFGLLGSLLGAPDALRSAWLPQACRGERKGGIAFGGLLPGPPVLTATPVDDGWLVDGFAPWVSGWGRIDTLHVAARGPDDTIVNLAIDATAGHGVTVTPHRLAAVDASGTVRLDFDSVAVGSERLLGIAPFDPAASLGSSLRLNGSLALGVARRCCRMVGSSELDRGLDECRAVLDEAGAEEMAAARARASAFALRAAGAAVADAGSGSIAIDQHPQRLLREAMFLLVFGSRPAIKSDLLAGLVG